MQPATVGEAMEVPWNVAVPEMRPVATIDEPGATMSKSAVRFEKQVRVSYPGTSLQLPLLQVHELVPEKS
jgi:hypothetical protein